MIFSQEVRLPSSTTSSLAKQLSDCALLQTITMPLIDQRVVRISKRKRIGRQIRNLNSSHRIVVWSSRASPHCAATKKILESVADLDIAFFELEDQNKNDLYYITRRRSLPAVFVNSRYLGGYSVLRKARRTGTLRMLLNWVHSSVLRRSHNINDNVIELTQTMTTHNVVWNSDKNVDMEAKHSAIALRFQNVLQSSCYYTGRYNHVFSRSMKSQDVVPSLSTNVKPRGTEEAAEPGKIVQSTKSKDLVDSSSFSNHLKETTVETAKSCLDESTCGESFQSLPTVSVSLVSNYRQASMQKH